MKNDGQQTDAKCCKVPSWVQLQHNHLSICKELGILLPFSLTSSKIGQCLCHFVPYFNIILFCELRSWNHFSHTDHQTVQIWSVSAGGRPRHTAWHKSSDQLCTRGFYFDGTHGRLPEKKLKRYPTQKTNHHNSRWPISPIGGRPTHITVTVTLWCYWSVHYIVRRRHE